MVCVQTVAAPAPRASSSSSPDDARRGETERVRGAGISFDCVREVQREGSVSVNWRAYGSQVHALTTLPPGEADAYSHILVVSCVYVSAGFS